MRQTDYDNRDLKQMNPKVTRLCRLLNLMAAKSSIRCLL